MSPLAHYHRPTTLTQALQLLERPNISTRVIAGGTSVTPQLGVGVDDVIDLQALEFKEIVAAGANVTIGSLATLQGLAESPVVPPVVREAARRDAPNTIRHAATLGGAIAAGDWESELLATLLAHEAVVTLERLQGSVALSLAEFLSARQHYLDHAIITQIALTTDGVAAAERTARTPADKPIVAVVARRTSQGQVHLALAGVATTPILAAPDALENLSPPGDFRGSSAYRKHLAGVLARRVLQQI